MTWKRRIVCIIATIGIISFLCLTPNIILENIGRNVYREWRERETPEHTCILEIWHVVGFKAYSGSVSTWVEKCAGELEKSNDGVYAEVSAMTKEEYYERISNGDSADIYSFPLGLEYADKFRPLEEKDYGLKPELANVGKSAGTTVAIPYMYSCYALMVNEDLFDNADSIPESVDCEWLSATANKLTTEKTGRKGKVTKTYGLSGNKLTAAIFGVESEMCDYDLFKEQQAVMAINDLRAVGDIVRLTEQGKGFPTLALPLTNYTDLVQLVGVDRDISEIKLAVAQEFIDILFTQKAQSEFIDYNAYPAIEFETVEGKTYSGVALKCLTVCENPRVPNCFLYKRYYDAMVEAAERSLIGDKAGKADLLDRLKELLNE